MERISDLHICRLAGGHASAGRVDRALGLEPQSRDWGGEVFWGS